MNKSNLLLLLIPLLIGCKSLHFVDAKGRDCRHMQFLFARWDTCEDEQEPLATTRQEIKVDADIRQDE